MRAPIKLNRYKNDVFIREIFAARKEKEKEEEEKRISKY